MPTYPSPIEFLLVFSISFSAGVLVPQGLGVLYVEDGLTELQPPYLAMSSMANPPADYIARPDDTTVRNDALRFEFGNVNLPELDALDAAIKFIESVGVAEIQKHAMELGDRLLAELDALGVSVVGPRGRGQRNHIDVLHCPSINGPTISPATTCAYRPNAGAFAFRWRCPIPSRTSTASSN